MLTTLVEMLSAPEYAAQLKALTAIVAEVYQVAPPFRRIAPTWMYAIIKTGVPRIHGDLLQQVILDELHVADLTPLN